MESVHILCCSMVLTMCGPRNSRMKSGFESVMNNPAKAPTAKIAVAVSV